MQKNRKHNSAALFGHFRGAKRLEGRREGNISIFWFAHGWFWFIPLADGSTSFGAVCWPHYLKSRNQPLQQFFADTVALSPALAERLQGATLIDDQVRATGNYSYRADRCVGDRFLMLGDTYAFVESIRCSRRVCIWPWSVPSKVPRSWPRRSTGLPALPPYAAASSGPCAGARASFPGSSSA